MPAFGSADKEIAKSVPEISGQRVMSAKVNSDNAEREGQLS
jgi:hypothetical protein